MSPNRDIATAAASALALEHISRARLLRQSSHKVREDTSMPIFGIRWSAHVIRWGVPGN